MKSTCSYVMVRPCEVCQFCGYFSASSRQLHTCCRLTGGLHAGCDNACHTRCAGLAGIPADDWFCAACSADTCAGGSADSAALLDGVLCSGLSSPEQSPNSAGEQGTQAQAVTRQMHRRSAQQTQFQQDATSERRARRRRRLQRRTAQHDNPQRFARPQNWSTSAARAHRSGTPGLEAPGSRYGACPYTIFLSSLYYPMCCCIPPASTPSSGDLAV